MILAASIATAFAIVLGYLLAALFARRIRRLEQAAERIAGGRFDEPVVDAAPDEVGQLARAFERMRLQLASLERARGEFIANASHELRTPLTAERTVLQVALADPNASAATLRSACEKVLRLGDQQQRLIDALLTLASSERGLERREPADLGLIAAAVVRDRAETARHREVRLDARLDSAPVTGDPALAESLIANLVDNALRYNLPGGWVQVTTTTAGGQALLSVRNSGPEVPPDQVDLLFEPFRRLGNSRTRRREGHGLGLAIVRAIATAHDAELAAAARPGGGLDITVTFPRL
jgi:signal transduction histidine kinase